MRRSYSSTAMTTTTPRPCFSIVTGSIRARSMRRPKPFLASRADMIFMGFSPTGAIVAILGESGKPNFNGLWIGAGTLLGRKTVNVLPFSRALTSAFASPFRTIGAGVEILDHPHRCVVPASSGAVRRPHQLRGDGGNSRSQGLLWWWAPEPSLLRAKDRHPHGPRPCKARGDAGARGSA